MQRATIIRGKSVRGTSVGGTGSGDSWKLVDPIDHSCKASGADFLGTT